jgi:hypothetical protein
VVFKSYNSLINTYTKVTLVPSLPTHYSRNINPEDYKSGKLYYVKKHCKGEKTDLEILRYLYIFSPSEYDKEDSEIPSVWLYVHMYVSLISA